MPFSPIFYVGEYGMIPQTRSGDGDPLDVLVPVTKLHIPWNSDRSPTHSSIEMSDRSNTDNKVLCVARNDPRYSSYKDKKDVEKHTLKEMSHFFQTYKALERKK